MTISIKNGKYLSGARKIFQSYASYTDIYNSTYNYPLWSSPTLDELNMYTSYNGGSLIGPSNSDGLYYIDAYIILQGTFYAGDILNVALYNFTDSAFSDIEDSGFGTTYITSSSELNIRWSIITNLISNNIYNINISNQSYHDFSINSSSFMRIYKF